MKAYIALFRGINVGGSHVLPMKDLKLVLEKGGCVDVQTYIQSGNVIFGSAISDSRRLARRLAVCVSRSYGFEPRVLVLTHSELEKAVAGNPYPQAEENPKSLHLFFLVDRPKKPDLKSLESLKTQTEAFVLKDTILYLNTPDGFGRSKLAARIERLLGVEGTARNWRTVTTLLAMITVRQKRPNGRSHSPARRKELPNHPHNLINR
jgi:uncharacterized protein (DUF1697 family)